MIICDYIKKINSTLSKVYKGDELIMTTDRDYLKYIPLTFINRVYIYLGEGFTDVQYSTNLGKTWKDVPSDRGEGDVYDYNNPDIIAYHWKKAQYGNTSYDYFIIDVPEGSPDMTISVRANWTNNRSTTSLAHNKTDFRFDMQAYKENSVSSGYKTGGLHVYGNINSLLSHTGWENITSLANYGTYTFRSLFNCVLEPDVLNIYGSSVISDEDLLGIYFPNTILSEGCYRNMFVAARNYLTKIPSNFIGPNVTLSPRCCEYMFDYCGSSKYDITLERDSLATTNLAPNCYSNMFYGSSSSNMRIKFDEGFKLPATTLATGCYSNMFENRYIDYRSSIPENLLPATNLADYCYSGMFKNLYIYDPTGETEEVNVDRSLKLKLPATNINGYNSMFEGSNITSIAKFPKGAILYGRSPLSGMYKNCKTLNSVELSFITGQNFGNLGCSSMFEGSSVTTATINLMGGNLSSRAFQAMFKGCTSLKTVNLNNVTNIDYPNCCNEMFSGCTNLTTVNTDLLEWPSVNTDSTTGWFNGVETKGTLKTKKNFDIPSGVNGLPTNWTHIYN